MTQANDSILVTPGAGATVATHLINGKEYQVVILGDSAGHIVGTTPSYFLWLPKIAVGANKLYADIFNATGSGKVLEINGIWCIPSQDVAVTGVLGVEVDLYRTSAVGTGGTAALIDRTNQTTPAFSMKDTANAAIPVQVTARSVPTAGATISSMLFGQYLNTEEGSTAMVAATAIGAFTNLLPEVRETQVLTIRENSGLLIKQGAIAGVGSLAFLVDFSLI
jgi:hypothetical protein